MKNLKSKFQLKIKIPKNDNKEDGKNLSKINNNNNNRASISQITNNILFTSGYLVAKDIITYLVKNNFTHVINCSHGSSMETPNDEIVKSQNYEKSPSIKYLSIFLSRISKIFTSPILISEVKNQKKNFM